MQHGVSCSDAAAAQLWAHERGLEAGPAPRGEATRPKATRALPGSPAAPLYPRPPFRPTFNFRLHPALPSRAARRIPLNAFVCAVLYNVHLFPLSAMFGLCSAFLLTAAALMVRIWLCMTRVCVCAHAGMRRRAAFMRQRVLMA